MKITVPSAEALTTALGRCARDGLVTLARALAQEIEATDDRGERHETTRLYLTVVRQIDSMDRAGVREARATARAEAAMDWMNRRDDERQKGAAARAAIALAKAKPAPGPTSAIIDELRQARDAKLRRQRKSAS